MRKVFYVLTTLFIYSSVNAQQNDTNILRLSNFINAEFLKKELNVIASKEFEGRETGTEGQRKAANYLAEYYKSLGFQPSYENSFFQKYNISSKTNDEVQLSVANKEYEFLKDYYFFPKFGDQNFVVKDAVFAGYGIVVPEKNYNDYFALDIKDKVVVIKEGEPLDKDGNSVLTGNKELSGWSTNWRAKHEEAKTRGAKAIFIITNNIDEKISKNKHALEKPMLSLEKENNYIDNIPVIYISEDIGYRIFNKKKINEYLEKTRGPKDDALKSDQITAFKLSRKNENEEACNVIAYIKGKDKPNEAIIISAHYDHLGVQGDKIFYGADDDGSGTVAVMNIAKALKEAEKQGKGPGRTVIFAHMSGEEKGLLGSSYYVTSPYFPLDKTVADLNIDMIGRLDKDHQEDPNYVYIIGSDKLSSELHEINENANKNVNIKLDYTYNQPNDPNRFYYRSDHYNFAKNNIPVIFYFTGVHEDYHQPSDTVDKIDFKKMEKITRLVYFTAYDLANRKERIKVDKKSNMPNNR